MAYKKKPVDLGELADKANEALTKLWEAGYKDEVKALRRFIYAEGDYFRETMQTNREINSELTRQLEAVPKWRVVPAPRYDPALRKVEAEDG